MILHSKLPLSAVHLAIKKVGVLNSHFRFHAYTIAISRDVPDVKFAGFRMPDVVCQIPEPDSGYWIQNSGKLKH